MDIEHLRKELQDALDERDALEERIIQLKKQILEATADGWVAVERNGQTEVLAICRGIEHRTSFGLILRIDIRVDDSGLLSVGARYEDPSEWVFVALGDTQEVWYASDEHSEECIVGFFKTREEAMEFAKSSEKPNHE